MNDQDDNRPEVWDGDDRALSEEEELEALLGRGPGDPDMYGYPGQEASDE